MPFYKGQDGNYLKLYRGECNHPAYTVPKAFPRAMYFGEVETANIYSECNEQSGNYYTSRVFEVYLVLNRPFINQPKDPFLEMGHVANCLGLSEARRIALRFAKYIEETDNWQLEVNPEKKFKGVADYVNSPIGDVTKLYFQAYRFFDSLMEVRRLRQLGYDGAIHAGSGRGSAHRPEYCVFEQKQVYFTASKTFLDGNE